VKAARSLLHRGPIFAPETRSENTECAASDRVPCFDILKPGCAMHHVPKPELMDAMKDCLRDLENTKLISPDDLDIIDEKRILRQKIAQLENEDSDSQQKAG